MLRRLARLLPRYWKFVNEPVTSGKRAETFLERRLGDAFTFRNGDDAVHGRDGDLLFYPVGPEDFEFLDSGAGT